MPAGCRGVARAANATRITPAARDTRRRRAHRTFPGRCSCVPGRSCTPSANASGCSITRSSAARSGDGVAGGIALHVGFEDGGDGALGGDDRRPRAECLEQRQAEAFAQRRPGRRRARRGGSARRLGCCALRRRRAHRAMAHRGQRPVVVAGEHQVDRKPLRQRRPPPPPRWRGLCARGGCRRRTRTAAHRPAARGAGRARRRPAG